MKMSLQDQNILHLSTNADSSTNSKKIAIKAKFNKNKLFLRSNFTPYMSKSFTIRDNFFPILYPRILNI